LCDHCPDFSTKIDHHFHSHYHCFNVDREGANFCYESCAAAAAAAAAAATIFFLLISYSVSLPQVCFQKSTCQRCANRFCFTSGADPRASSDQQATKGKESRPGARVDLEDIITAEQMESANGPAAKAPIRRNKAAGAAY
jgi:hypothetical protein